MDPGQGIRGDRFESTTDKQWDNLAAMAQQEISIDNTIPLDKVFPPRL
jgi:hypothetical protein